MNKFMVFVILCLCLANVVYAQGEICQHKATDVEEMSNNIMVLKSTKQPIKAGVKEGYAQVHN